MHSIEKKIYLGIMVCVLISMVGVSFAYFTAGTGIFGSGSSTNIKIEDLIHVAYNAGSSSLSLNNAKPGDKISKTFTITVSPIENQKTVKYAIQLVVDETDRPFVRCTTQTTDNHCQVNAKELAYTLKKGSTIIKTGDLLDLSVGINTLAEISENIDSAAAPITYTLELEYVDTGVDQNHNMNKFFSANVKVVFAE